MSLQARTLSAEEVQERFPKRGHMDLADYEELFQELQPGQAKEVVQNGISLRALKRRLGQAAKHILGDRANLRYDVGKDEDGHPTLAFQLRYRDVKATRTQKRR